MADSFWSSRRTLVTGAGGFLGSWLAHALIERGSEVTVVIRDEPALSNLRLLGDFERANVVKGSITDFQLMERLVNEYEIDTCFHVAAQAIVGPANRSPLSTFESNIEGTWCVLEACRLAGVERTVVASSDKAYGAQPVLPYDEAMPLLGSSPYEASKVCTEILARSYHLSFGLPLAITRCANIYGGGDVNFSRLVPGTIRSILNDERPIIRSDGTPVRDYIHVDDAVSAYLTTCEQLARPEVLGSAFNFGTDNPISALELVDRILKLSGATHFQPDVRGTGSLAGEIDRQFLNSDRAHRVLGWKPRVPLDEGLGRAIQWYRDLWAVEHQAEAVPGS